MIYPEIPPRMTAEEYQDELTSIQDRFPEPVQDVNPLIIYLLALSGNTGKVSEMIKRYFTEGVYPDKTFTEELGDIVAYIVLICNQFNIRFLDVLVANIDKLNERLEKGTAHGNGSDR